LKKPVWSESRLPRPGDPGFSSIPGEQQLATDLDGRRRIMSGAGELPYDVAADVWLVDQKETTLLSYTIKKKKLEDLAARALAEGRQPMVSIVFWTGQHRGEPWMLVPQSTLLALAQLATKEI
jgi:hypothetical protein